VVSLAWIIARIGAGYKISLASIGAGGTRIMKSVLIRVSRRLAAARTFGGLGWGGASEVLGRGAKFWNREGRRL
jgi:hypothetical protein